jgi:hypothetical protein
MKKEGIRKEDPACEIIRKMPKWGIKSTWK